MLFNSLIYIFLFVPIVFLIYFSSRHFTKKSHQGIILVIASYVYYAYWDYKYVLLIFSSIYCNYFIGKHLNQRKSKTLLIIGILLNLGPLIFFKYSNFLLQNVNHFFHTNLPTLNLVLPLAISFFTFQQIAYLVDSYKAITNEHNFTSYSLFVSFFPQLIAGPIVHHKEMMPQFSQTKNLSINTDNIRDGIIIFCIGLFKKVVIADSFISIVSKGFDTTVNLDFFEAWITTLSYTYQLYFDFSGYCDMAIGSALLFNVTIPENFASPYLSRNIKEFWRRWHITLGRWLRDYIYIPLGGNRCTSYRENFNLFMTFLIGGIWHGAGWNFVIWGTLHGAALVFLNIMKPLRLKYNYFLSIFMTFIYVHFAWVFFRAKTFNRAKEIIISMFNFESIYVPNKISSMLSLAMPSSNKPFLLNLRGDNTSGFILFMIITASILVFTTPNSQQHLSRIKDKSYTPYFAGILFAFTILFLSRKSEFLYFQF